MRPLGDAIVRAHPDWAVLGPQLAGHGIGTGIEGTRALARTGWRDWYASVERAYVELSHECDRIFVCGLSLGGLLTLELVRNRPQKIAAIAVMATALYLDPRAEK